VIAIAALPEADTGYVVTRSRPYLTRRSREVLAVSGWERQRDSGGDVIASLP
jgi:hypothetical protein